LYTLDIWLRFFVHPGNKFISLQRMLVWAYHFTTTFPLMQPINADNFSRIMFELLPFLDFEIWLRFFVNPRNQPISLQRMLVWYYTFTTTFQLVQQINAEIVILVCICVSYDPWRTYKFWTKPITQWLQPYSKSKSR